MSQVVHKPAWPNRRPKALLWEAVISSTDSESLEHAVDVAATSVYEGTVLAFAEFRRCGFAVAQLGESLLRNDTSHLYGVARELPGKRDVLSGEFLKIVKVLVINLEDLALAHQNVFAATFDARQRTVFV